MAIMRAAERRTFIDGAVGAFLPAEQGGAAVGAPVRSLGGAVAARQGREAATNFAAQLGGFVAVIGIGKLAGGMAVRTAASARQGVESQALDGGEGPVVLALVLFAQLPPVQGGDRGGWLGEGSARIDGEVAVVRMLSAKVIARLRLCLGVGEDPCNCWTSSCKSWRENFLQSQSTKRGMLPMAVSLSGTWQFPASGMLERETSPLFCCAVKSPRALRPPAQDARHSTHRSCRRRLIRGEKARIPVSPAKSEDYQQ